jgi:signal transduction histidine kinase
MTLQGKLTLGSVLLATLIVGIVSAVDLGNVMELEFAATLERAQLLKAVSSVLVGEALNRQRTVPVREALRDPELSNALINILTASRAILEVAVLTPENEIIADSDPERVSVVSPPHPDFADLVKQSSWFDKAKLLLWRETEYYQLEQTLGPPNGKPLVLVRVIVAPALIYEDIQKTLASSAVVALLSLVGAVTITFLASAVAFRPLGQIGRMLDLVARGEFEPENPNPARRPAKAATDELSIMASKVSMLGQRLRGAQFEVSDLRGNIDRLLQDLEDAVFIFDRDRRLIFASGSVEKFLGTERTGLAGEAVTEIFPPSTTLGLMIAQASQTGRPVRNRRVPLISAGESGGAAPVVLLSVDMLETLPGSAGTGAGFLVRLRDPEAQRKIGRELQTADRLSAISRITGGVAHEVKNPLNAILLHVEVAKAKLKRGDTDIEQQMEIISGEIVRLDRVVKTFLDFTRPVELNLTNVPVQQFTEELAELAKPQAKASNIRIEIIQDAEGVEVRVDRDLMKQALLNIVVNAMQAMPEGGILRLEALANEDTAEIRISDTGQGIPPELREKIFRLYFTTKKEGSGIGLAMTFRMVQLHDGTIDFTSEPGKGTVFFIRLPIAG